MNSAEELKAPDGRTIALLVRSGLDVEGVNFVSPADYLLQVGVLNHRGGTEIQPHFHRERQIRIDRVMELVYVEAGKVIADLYAEGDRPFKSVELTAGDAILFVDGGHGFRVLEDAKMIEVKQGPYLGKDVDKESVGVGP